MSLNELREMPEARKLLRLFLTAFIVWLLFIALLARVVGMNNELRDEISSGSQVLNAASTYRSFRAAQAVANRHPGDADPLSVVSDVLDAHNLRDRTLQLQSSSSVLTLQLERVYGNEMEEFLSTLESRGIFVRTAEIRVLPSGDDRLLGATFSLEQNQ